MTLYISDLDGTLLNDNAELSEFTKRGLNKIISGGIKFTAATARGSASASVILGGLSLSVPIVLLNGVFIYDMKRRVYEKIYKIAADTAAVIINTIRRFETTGFIYTYKNGQIFTYHETPDKKPLKDFIKSRINRYNESSYHTDSFPDDIINDAVYFTMFDEYAALLPIKKAIENIPGQNHVFYHDNYNEGLWWLEIFAGDASKKHAAEYLRDTYCFSRIVCFGDNYNDLPMFEAADVKIAAANAVPELKAAADYICGSNNDDGVVKWLLQNI